MTTAALELSRPQAVSRLEFTPAQTQMIRDTFANGASDEEFAVLMEIAKARSLNPLLRQIWFVQRWDNQKKRYVWAVQISIDGLRAVAERSGRYDGQDEPEYFYDDKNRLQSVKIRVYKSGIKRPFVGIAHWSEYVGTTKDGNVTKMWADKPHVMLGKCAESLALRKAFPEDTSGLYIPEETGRDVIEMPANELPSPSETAKQLADTSKMIDDWKAKIAATKSDEDLAVLVQPISKLPTFVKNALKTAYGDHKKKLKEAEEPEPPPPAAEGDWVDEPGVNG